MQLSEQRQRPQVEKRYLGHPPLRSSRLGQASLGLGLKGCKRRDSPRIDAEQREYRDFKKRHPLESAQIRDFNALPAELKGCKRRDSPRIDAEQREYREFMLRSTLNFRLVRF